MMIKYRPDIDGLRALAVLAVIFYHLNISAIPGGYVGVDVFFVISGYLITQIIIKGLSDNTFSLYGFYERRIRRIIPALAVVIVCTLAAGFIILLPEALVNLGKSAIATSVFASNIYFYEESGYFDRAAALKPLLHTWSLGIEEQFYILFPLLLIFIHKRASSKYFAWLLSIAVISLLLCVQWTSIKTVAAFYWLPTRAWELLAGSIISLNILQLPDKRSIREIISILGISLIIYSIFSFTSKTYFPGTAAIAPTLGAALVIIAGSSGKSTVTTVLGYRPLVFVGLISYSLYLWHWPVLVYTKMYLIKRPETYQLILILFSIFVLSVISWKYVEAPFRNKTLLRNNRALVLSFTSLTAVIIICGIFMVNSEGYPYRIHTDSSRNAKIDRDKWNHWGKCEKEIAKDQGERNLCDLGNKDSEDRFILWGDSHARTLASGVDMSAKKHGVGGIIATQSACPPVLSLGFNIKDTCRENNKRVLEHISSNKNIKIVLLASRWNILTTGERYKEEKGAPPRLVNTDSKNLHESNHVKILESGLMVTIKTLIDMGKKVVIIGPVPEIGHDVPSAYRISMLTGRDVNYVIAPTIDEYRLRSKDVLDIFKRINNKHETTFVRPDIYLCNKEICKVAVDDDVLYRDDDHLSTYGSEYISRAYDSIFHNLELDKP